MGVAVRCESIELPDDTSVRLHRREVVLYERWRGHARRAQRFEMAHVHIADADGTVRVSGAEILARIIRDGADQPIGEKARSLMHPLQQDVDHRCSGRAESPAACIRERGCAIVRQ